MSGPGPRPAPPTARSVEAELRTLGDPDDATFLARYFKCGPGEYGEGDVFLGIRVPVLRRRARAHVALSLDECGWLLASPVHEARLLALLILCLRYAKGDEAERAAIHRAYTRALDRVNNWDLVDLSAPRLLGEHLLHRSRAPLDQLARSRSLWRRRVAVLATQAFIRRGEFADTLRIADLLLGDEEDLIHKAVGWMLREVGKRDAEVLRRFLAPRYRRMPRTMLRYAIERFPAPTRKRYLKGEA